MISKRRVSGLLMVSSIASVSAGQRERTRSAHSISKRPFDPSILLKEKLPARLLISGTYPCGKAW